MTAARDLLLAWAERRINTQGVEIAVRTGGSGPPLLRHGYPQTHACWHKIAAKLARHCTLVLADLRGCGASSVPADTPEHRSFAKQTMALDCLAVMGSLGHARFMVGGHDRGGRVAYRLALDHSEAIMASQPIDILPTAEVWRRVSAESALASYHWGFLAQPAPTPERLISADPQFYLEHTLKSWAKSAEPLQVWGAWCGDLSGAEIDSGHFLAEENPRATLAAVLPFIGVRR
jgi:haloacetate dehalogenase